MQRYINNETNLCIDPARGVLVELGPVIRRIIACSQHKITILHIDFVAHVQLEFLVACWREVSVRLSGCGAYRA